MDMLTACFEYGFHRILREPINLEVRHKASQRIDDRYVALDRAETNWTGHKNDPPVGSAPGPTPFALGRSGRSEKIMQQDVEPDRITRLWCMSATFKTQQRRLRNHRVESF